MCCMHGTPRHLIDTKHRECSFRNYFDTTEKIFAPCEEVLMGVGLQLEHRA